MSDSYFEYLGQTHKFTEILVIFNTIIFSVPASSAERQSNLHATDIALHILATSCGYKLLSLSDVWSTKPWKFA